ncbi:MAG: energy-coupling factor ABC transporter ATP-binding protein [Coriobacteriales bacterium]|jgi:energy-coupling factor transporter ATP-binding protein EcfA2
MISIEHLSFGYERGTGKALDDVTLEIQAGDFVGICGESGSGKTTLGHCINGVIPHHFKGDYYGSVKVEGKDTFDQELTDIARTIGTVSQDIDGSMVAAIVEDELVFGLENFGVPEDEANARIEQALDQVGISNLRHRQISTLSGGQKQKVAIATLLALAPRVLLLDEPTAELDPFSSRQIFELLKELNEQGATVIVIEQKAQLLAEFASRLVVMEKGRIVTEGPTREVCSHAEGLLDHGICCPPVTLLADELAREGMRLSSTPLTVPEAARIIREAIA